MIEGIYPAQFVEELLAHEQAGEGFIHLTGFVSPEHSDGSTRLYVDADLSGWIEVRDEDIVRAIAPPQEHPDWPTRLWVRRTAEVLCGTAPTVERRDLYELVDLITARKWPPTCKHPWC